MYPPFRILMIALIACAWTSLASAESPVTNQAHQIVPALTDLSLDNAFEQATSPKSDANKVALPTIMDCQGGPSVDGLEVCVVTVDGLLASMPASMPAAIAPR